MLLRDGRIWELVRLFDLCLELMFAAFCTFQMADLSDLEDHKETFQHLALYEAALLELTYGSVPCRCLR